MDNIQSVIDNALAIILREDAFKNFYKTAFKADNSTLLGHVKKFLNTILCNDESDDE